MLFLPIFIALILETVIGGWLVIRREGRKPARFVLVAEGQQFADEGDEKGGPIWRAQRWFDRHPFVKWAGTLLLGALVGALIAHALYH
ncbi:MAG TPA: hypothetical protein VHU86_06815 [Solirubrobacterales bacterium]|nr:hypothetical protein [Solirubrobacterales bacterium]